MNFYNFLTLNLKSALSLVQRCAKIINSRNKQFFVFLLSMKTHSSTNKHLANHSGFTLIELLIAIVIIGILAGLSIFLIDSARIKSRDVKRIADLRQIKQALELYYLDNSSYPSVITTGQTLTGPGGNTTYMALVPSNPTPRTDGSCPDIDYKYYQFSNDFSLYACLGKGSGDLAGGSTIANNNQVDSLNNSPLDNGLIAWYPLDSRTFSNSKAYDLANPGVYASCSTNCPVIINAGTPATGLRGTEDILFKTVGVDGGQTSVLTGSANSGLSGNPNFTIAFWFYLDYTNWGTWWNIIGFQNVSSGDASYNGKTLTVDFYYISGDTAHANVWLDFKGYVYRTNYSAAAGLTAKTWYYIAMTHTAGTNPSASKIYINGAEETNTTSIDGAINITAAPIVFNGWPGGGACGASCSPVRYRMEDFRVYNRVLSATEINQLYTRTLNNPY